MKILVLTRYHNEGPSSRVRFYQYLPYLQESGIECHVFPLFHKGYVSARFRNNREPGKILLDYIHRKMVLFRVFSFDLLWIQGELFPRFPAIFERLLSSLGVPYIVDYDDAIFHYYTESNNLLFNRLLRNKIAVVMRNAAAVVSGNSYNADYAAASGAKRIMVLPSVVDLKDFPEPQMKSDSQPFTVGWVGTPITARFLSEIQPALAEFKKDKHVQLRLIGSDQVNLGDIHPEIIPWEKQREAEEIGRFDVGIMPLTDDPFSRGKSGYKLILYMALGKPVIASPVGANRDIVEHGVNGFLAASREEWVEALNRLYIDPDLRWKLGIMGRKRVESSYSIQVAAPKLLELFHSVV